MTESFTELFNESIENIKMQTGAIINGIVVKVSSDYVVVNAGLKSEGVILAEEFQDENGELTVVVGDQVRVAIESVEDGFGETILSREKAKRHESWHELEQAYEAGNTITGVIVDRVKGGFIVVVNDVRAFLPGSLIDVKPIRDPSHLEGKDLEFKVIKLDHKRNNIVVSRRAVLQTETSADRQALLDNLQEGQEIKGIVKNLTDYGAFIDLGGIDGLLHITDMSWKRVKHPSELLNTGDEITVKILRFDRERNRVSLGIKQLGEDPWADLTRRFPEGSRLFGKVTNITDYGCFVEIEEGVEGLVHMSEMDWTNKNIHPSKRVQLGDEIEVMVLEINPDRRRISLGMKQCVPNPWQTFAEKHGKGDKISAQIKSITDFGIFIGLDGGIDGLVYLSDISWSAPGEEAIHSYKKGQEIETVILAIDAERERISLGIKQIEDDPFSAYTSLHPKNSVVTGKILAIDAKTGITIELATQVTGNLKSAELREIEGTEPKVGDAIEAKMVHIDKRNRTITLSIKAKHEQEEADAIKHYHQQVDEPSGGATKLGDLLKETIEKTGGSDDE